jgi:outer membrane receptor protein involved in Fe transport
MKPRAALAVILAVASTPPAFAQAAAEEEMIIVTGSRIPRPGDDSPSPIETVRPEAFVLTGVGNVEQTLNQLPQIMPSFTSTSNNPGTGAATLDLRGLGSVRTLVLVNGRRWIADDAGQVPEIDVNTIPAALIERVDIVTGGASAAYGSDAVTGVVNFVLKDRLQGVHLDARQSVTEQGDGRVSSADLSFGLGKPGGRGHLLVSAGWLDQAAITQGGRRLSTLALADGCAVPGTRNGMGASTPVADPSCPAPNVYALIAGGSATIPGSRIPGIFLPGPGTQLVRAAPGIRFDPDGTPRPFSVATDRYNFAPGNYLQVGFERVSFNAIGDYEISPGATVYSELAWIRTRSPQQLAPTGAMLGQTTPTVPAPRLNLDNPFLTAEARRLLDISFGVDAEGDRGFVGSAASGFRVNPAYGGDADGLVQLPALLSRLTGLGPRQSRNQRDAWRGLFGLRGGLGGEWSYDAYYSRSRVEHEVDLANGGSALRLQQAILAVRDPVTGAITCRDPSGGCVPANIFGPGNLSPAAADFIRTHPLDLTIVGEQVAEANIQGALPWTSAGPASLLLGASWRRSGYRFVPDPSLFTGDELGFSPGVPAAGSTEVAELFGEARLPLLADRPWAHALSVELGLRFSHYDTVGGTWTWKLLGQWAPVEQLRLRGGYQKAVRAPNVRELFEEPTIGFGEYVDPCAAAAGLLGRAEIRTACLRDGILPGLLGTSFLEDGAATLTGGNRKLKAETAGSWTFGLVANPTASLTATIDYYDIRIRNAIGAFGGGPLFVVAGCIFSGADPVNPLCAAYDRSEDGSVLSIAQPSANLPSARARGIDWNLSWKGRLGLLATDDRIDLSTSGTRSFENGFKPNAQMPRFDCTGLFGAPCGATIGGTAMPRWKLLNQLGYEAGAARLTLRHRWFSATSDARIAVDEAFGLSPRRIAEEGRRLEARHYFDLAATLRAGEAWTLTTGVNNLGDRKPAITGSNQVQANTDPSLYDMLGRRWFVALAAQLR